MRWVDLIYVFQLDAKLSLCDVIVYDVVASGLKTLSEQTASSLTALADKK